MNRQPQQSQRRLKVAYQGNRLDSTNRYTCIVASLLEDVGAEVVELDHRAIEARDIDCYLFNWFNIGDAAFSASVLAPWARLAYLVLARKTVIFVHHNRVPHDTRFLRWARLLQLSCYLFARYIIVHNQHDLLALARRYGKKTVFVPHPNYIGEYGNLQAPNIPTQKLRLCFLGQIRPYKNIEVLIAAFRRVSNPDLELWIFGKAMSEQYANGLVDAIDGDPRITLVNKYVPDTDIPRILSEVDAIVLPYSMDSVSNSGAAILAISYGKPTIVPRIPGVESWPLAGELIYSYKTVTDHQEELVSRIRAIAARGRSWLDLEGQRLREFAETELSHSATAAALAGILKSLQSGPQ